MVVGGQEHGGWVAGAWRLDGRLHGVWGAWCLGGMVFGGHGVWGAWRLGDRVHGGWGAVGQEQEGVAVDWEVGA